MAGLGDEFNPDMSYSETETLLNGQYLNVRLDENFDTAEEFCQKARRVLDLLKPLGLPDAEILITQQDGRGTPRDNILVPVGFPAEKLVNLCTGWEDTLNVQIQDTGPDEVEISFDE